MSYVEDLEGIAMAFRDFAVRSVAQPTRSNTFAYLAR